MVGGKVVSPPHLDVSLEAIRMCLRNLEETIASLFQLRLLLPEGPLRERLIDQVSALDFIADVMRSLFIAMPGAVAIRHSVGRSYCYIINDILELKKDPLNCQNLVKHAPEAVESEIKNGVLTNAARHSWKTLATGKT